MTTKNNAKFTSFCNLWTSIGVSVIHDANRRIEAAGYEATMAYLAQQRQQEALLEQCPCNLCQYARKHPQIGARRCWE